MPCDFDVGPPGVGIEEFITILGRWESCEACDFCPVCGENSKNSCCVTSGSPGCNNDTCCLAVCQLLPHCCEDGWDVSCREEANTIAACECDT